MAIRYVSSDDRDPEHYQPAEGLVFAEGDVPPIEYCPECGQITLMVYRWKNSDGVECFRPYPEDCDCGGGSTPTHAAHADEM